MRPFLRAEWRHLAMLNYALDPALLQPYVPAGTELDFDAGKAYLSLVGFRFLSTRVAGVGIPFHRNFDEVNLRFYVRRIAPDGIRRGVVFIREIVPRSAIALIARQAYNEPYVRLPMRHAVAISNAGISTRYEWRVTGRWNRLQADAQGPPAACVEGSHEQFITEHYWGYTKQRSGATKEYRVEHPSWRVWQASEAGFDGDATTLYGPEFAAILQRPPDSALIAEGSEVTVFQGCRLEP